MNQSTPSAPVRECRMCEADISHRGPAARFCNPQCSDKYRSVRDPDRYKRNWANRTPEQIERTKQWKRDYVWLEPAESKARKAEYTREYRARYPERAATWSREGYRARAAAERAQRKRKTCASIRCTGDIPSSLKVDAIYCSQKCKGYMVSLECRHRNRASRAAADRQRSSAKASSRIAGNVTPSSLSARIAYYGNACWMCGDEWSQLDHVKPISKGGPHILSNLRPACGPCNNRKRDHWPWPATRQLLNGGNNGR